MAKPRCPCGCGRKLSGVRQVGAAAGVRRATRALSVMADQLREVKVARQQGQPGLDALVRTLDLMVGEGRTLREHLLEHAHGTATPAGTPDLLTLSVEVAALEEVAYGAVPSNSDPIIIDPDSSSGPVRRQPEQNAAPQRDAPEKLPPWKGAPAKKAPAKKAPAKKAPAKKAPAKEPQRIKSETSESATAEARHRQKKKVARIVSAAWVVAGLGLLDLVGGSYAVQSGMFTVDCGSGLELVTSSADELPDVCEGVKTQALGRLAVAATIVGGLAYWQSQESKKLGEPES